MKGRGLAALLPSGRVLLLPARFSLHPDSGAEGLWSARSGARARQLSSRCYEDEPSIGVQRALGPVAGRLPDLCVVALAAVGDADAETRPDRLNEIPSVVMSV